MLLYKIKPKIINPIKEKKYNWSLMLHNQALSSQNLKPIEFVISGFFPGREEFRNDHRDVTGDVVENVSQSDASDDAKRRHSHDRAKLVSDVLILRYNLTLFALLLKFDAVMSLYRLQNMTLRCDFIF